MSSETNNDAAESADSIRSQGQPAPGDEAPHAPSSSAPSVALPSVIVDPSLQPPDAQSAAAQSTPAPVAETEATTHAATTRSAPTATTPTAAPSVIVDPSLLGPVAGTSSTPRASSTDTSTGERAVDDDAEAWAPGELDALDAAALSSFEADKFADSLRASWDALPAETSGAWASGITSTAHAPLAFTPTATPKPTPHSADSDGLPPVVVSRGIDKRMLMVIGSVVSVIVLVIWGISSSSTELPDSNAVTGAESSPTPAPAQLAPNKIDAPPPAPEPSAAPVANEANAANEANTAVDTPPSPEPVAAPTPAPEPAAIPTPVAEPVPAPAIAKSVHIRVSTKPASAELKLDGESIPNPFDAWVARGGSHSIVVSADGYVQRQWPVTFDTDQTLSLVLKREATKRAAPRREKRPAARAQTTNNRPRGAGFVTDNPFD